MNQMISNAVARGWISFPDPAAVPAHIEAPKFNAKRAWKMWNEGQSLAYVAKAIGVKKRAVWAIIQEGRP
jgi:hypothetical protein